MDVGPVEEIAEEDGVRDIEEDRYAHIKPRSSTSLSVDQRANADIVDENTDKHLGELDSGDGGGDPAWRISSTGLYGIVAIH